MTEPDNSQGWFFMVPTQLCGDTPLLLQATAAALGAAAGGGGLAGAAGLAGVAAPQGAAHGAGATTATTLALETRPSELGVGEEQGELEEQLLGPTGRDAATAPEADALLGLPAPSALRLAGGDSQAGGGASGGGVSGGGGARGGGRPEEARDGGGRKRRRVEGGAAGSGSPEGGQGPSPNGDGNGDGGARAGNDGGTGDAPAATEGRIELDERPLAGDRSPGAKAVQESPAAATAAAAGRSRRRGRDGARSGGGGGVSGGGRRAPAGGGGAGASGEFSFVSPQGTQPTPSLNGSEADGRTYGSGPYGGQEQQSPPAAEAPEGQGEAEGQEAALPAAGAGLAVTPVNTAAQAVPPAAAVALPMSPVPLPAAPLAAPPTATALDRLLRRAAHRGAAFLVDADAAEAAAAAAASGTAGAGATPAAAGAVASGAGHGDGGGGGGGNWVRRHAAAAASLQAALRGCGGDQQVRGLLEDNRRLAEALQETLKAEAAARGRVSQLQEQLADRGRALAAAAAHARMLRECIEGMRVENASVVQAMRAQEISKKEGRRLYLHSRAGNGAATAKNGDDICRVAGVCLLPAFVDKYPEARVWVDGGGGKGAVCYRLVKQGPAGQEVLAMAEV
ncbi:hypothetical protein HYH03_014247 [Edaphochlamys debaryana]|uniref:Uncharacterized protein n=1 Tax=Edaphochlamys debaryana TaxID=47281 RepID=A0A836BTS0_9CHLO|nr:hypothetical protein HYH03_014247 [Edaphochlamys debaryana]|eukprot:KAG2487134.1 hypothetical protein HYH03_014247 [Edaphochlamys debaryana]